MHKSQLSVSTILVHGVADGVYNIQDNKGAQAVKNEKG